MVEGGVKRLCVTSDSGLCRGCGSGGTTPHRDVQEPRPRQLTAWSPPGTRWRSAMCLGTG